MISNHSIDHFSRCFERAVAKTKQRRLTAQANHPRQTSESDKQAATGSIAKQPVALTDEEYQVSLLSKMSDHLRASKKQTDWQ